LEFLRADLRHPAELKRKNGRNDAVENYSILLANEQL
jgi:hypothetical protein